MSKPITVEAVCCDGKGEWFHKKGDCDWRWRGRRARKLTEMEGRVNNFMVLST